MEDQLEEIARDEQANVIDLYTYATPNGRKASIMLEETGLSYEVHIVDIERGDQRSPEFRALNPNGKIPVIVDRENGRTVLESGAILFYLAEKSGRFNPPTPEARIGTLQWLFFQVGHVGPMLGLPSNSRMTALGRKRSLSLDGGVAHRVGGVSAYARV